MEAGATARQDNCTHFCAVVHNKLGSLPPIEPAPAPQVDENKAVFSTFAVGTAYAFQISISGSAGQGAVSPPWKIAGPFTFT
jgi:hypothetical protein